MRRATLERVLEHAGRRVGMDLNDADGFGIVGGWMGDVKPATVARRFQAEHVVSRAENLGKNESHDRLLPPYKTLTRHGV